MIIIMIAVMTTFGMVMIGMMIMVVLVMTINMNTSTNTNLSGINVMTIHKLPKLILTTSKEIFVQPILDFLRVAVCPLVAMSGGTGTHRTTTGFQR